MSRSFLLVAASASLATILAIAACGSSEGTGDCPQSSPNDGEACGKDGLSCTYSEGCATNVFATCKGGVWSIGYEDCPAVCPDTLPADGTDCGDPLDWKASCTFPVANCGGKVAAVSCTYVGSQAVWQVQNPTCP